MLQQLCPAVTPCAVSGAGRVSMKLAKRSIVTLWLVGKDTACSSSTVASACALKVTRHTSYSCPEVAGAGVGRTSSGRSSSSSACSSLASGRGAALRLPGSVLSGASSPGAAGRGDALRPLVLRRNSSGGLDDASQWSVV